MSQVKNAFDLRNTKAQGISTWERVETINLFPIEHLMIS